MRRTPLLQIAGTLLLLAVATIAAAQDEFERAPIEYSKRQPKNCVSRLQEKLDGREATLAYDDEHGYLKAVLTALDVPLESQVLVFSKTSLQQRRISPRTPRAIYFRDDVYVGFCQSGDVLEVSAVDPQLGAVFYTLDQRKASAPPRFERRADSCLTCHSSSRTGGVPGHLVRSLYVEPSGHPLFSGGSRSVDHTTPIEERWGGWYVTGRHGAQKHRGNLIVERGADPHSVDNSSGQNVVSLADRLNVDRYLSPHSDIVALMILEHQALVHNRITGANFATRQALAYDAVMAEALDSPPGTRLESTTRRIQSAGDKLVDALLLVDEAPLTDAIRGTSGFAETFARDSPRDSRGRSLRDLDLSRRLFKYPCSYLIYSEAFAGLPPEVKDYVWQRIWEVLSGQDRSEKFSHLSAQDRQALVEILRETTAGLPTS